MQMVNSPMGPCTQILRLDLLGSRSALNCRGFTLLEVLVALAVVAVALAALLKGSGEHARNSAYLRDKTLAHWVALNKIAELQIQPEWPSIGKQHGTSEMGLTDWQWVTSVSNTPDKDIRRLEVEVRYAEDGTDPIVTRIAFLSGREVVGTE